MEQRTFDRALWLKEIPCDCVCDVMGADMYGNYLIFVDYNCPIHGYEAQTKENPMNCPHCGKPIEYTDNHELTIHCPHCNGLVEVDRQGIGIHLHRAWQHVVYMRKYSPSSWPAIERQFSGKADTVLVYD